ncbi:Uncharacterised protein [Serratia liquefaciens]|nr:Uncharacterised protein [Serratia liquefaciens]
MFGNNNINYGYINYNCYSKGLKKPTDPQRTATTSTYHSFTWNYKILQESRKINRNSIWYQWQLSCSFNVYRLNIIFAQ